MEGMTALLHGDVLSRECVWSLDRGEGCGKAAKSEVTQGKQKESCFFLGPSAGTCTKGSTEAFENTRECFFTAFVDTWLLLKVRLFNKFLD